MRTQALAVLIGFALMLGCAAVSAENAVEVTAHLKQDKNNRILLNFTLSNCGTKLIKIQDGSLPWHLDYTTLVAYIGVGKFARPVPGVLMIADYPFHQISIKPKATVRGSVELASIFPSIPSLKSYSDLIIFWSYRPDLSVTKTFGGMLTLNAPVVRMSPSCASE